MYKVFFLLILSTAHAQIDLDGTCNFTELITPYNASTIAGRWYQLERINSTFDTGDCSTITFTIVMSSGTPTSLEFSSREVSGGILLYRNASVSFSANYFGVLNFTFGDGDSYDFVIIPVSYYEHESIVLYSCQNNGNRSSVWAWKLGKNLIQSPEAKKATEVLIASVQGLSNATWLATSFDERACKVNAGVKIYVFSPYFVILVSFSLVKRNYT